MQIKEIDSPSRLLYKLQSSVTAHRARMLLLVLVVLMVAGCGDDGGGGGY